MADKLEIQDIILPDHETLLDHIQSYLEQNNIHGTDFGGKYLNDTGAISRLKSGKDIRLSKLKKIYKVLKG